MSKFSQHPDDAIKMLWISMHSRLDLPHEIHPEYAIVMSMTMNWCFQNQIFFNISSCSMATTFIFMVFWFLKDIVCFQSGKNNKNVSICWAWVHHFYQPIREKILCKVGWRNFKIDMEGRIWKSSEASIGSRCAYGSRPPKIILKVWNYSLEPLLSRAS